MNKYEKKINYYLDELLKSEEFKKNPKDTILSFILDVRNELIFCLKK